MASTATDSSRASQAPLASAALAYTSLVNTAMMTIAAIDDRRLHEDDGPRDHAALIRDLGPITAGSAGISLLTRDLLTRFTGTPQEIAAAQDRYYRYVLERLMDGLEADLEAGAHDGDPQVDGPADSAAPADSADPDGADGADRPG